MLWCNVLDFRYAADQPDDVLGLVADRCYRPLLAILESALHARVTASVDGTLLERCARAGLHDVVDGLGRLVQAGQVELVGTAAGNTVLSAVDPDMAARAIDEHQRTITRFFGDLYRPAGFFPPELAYAPSLGALLARLGFRWVLTDETAAENPMTGPLHQCRYGVGDADGLKVFFRNRAISTGLLYRGFSGRRDVLDAVGEPLSAPGYLITATAAEIYGYHHRGYEALLAELLGYGGLPTATVSDLLDRFTGTDRSVRLKQSSWSPWATLQY